jgi:hypothetical protein
MLLHQALPHATSIPNLTLLNILQLLKNMAGRINFLPSATNN